MLFFRWRDIPKANFILKETMVIFINHKESVVNEDTNLQLLLSHLDLKEEGIALAVDNQVIPKNEWSNFKLKENSKVTLIRATQGG